MAIYVNTMSSIYLTYAKLETLVGKEKKIKGSLIGRHHDIVEGTIGEKVTGDDRVVFNMAEGRASGRVIRQLNGELFFFEQPERFSEQPNKPETSRYVPMLNGEIEEYSQARHSLIHSEKVWVNVQQKRGRTPVEFQEGVSLYMSSEFFDQIPDLEHRAKKLKLNLLSLTEVLEDNATNKSQKVVKDVNGTTVHMDLILAARLVDMGITMLEFSLNIALAIKGVINMGEKFGFGKSFKAKMKEKKSAIKLRHAELND